MTTPAESAARCQESHRWDDSIIRCDLDAGHDGGHIHDLGDGNAVGWGNRAAQPKTGWEALSDADKAEWAAMILEQRDPETKACTCGYPKKECLRVVLRNGPPYPARPCEPEPTICDAKPPSHMKPCQKRLGHGGAHGALDGSQGWR